MARPEILSERTISIVELKEELEKIKTRDKELGFRSAKTEDYLNHFAELSPKKAEELKSKLNTLKISRLKEEYITKILDTLPVHVDDLRILLQGYIVSLSKKDMEDIVNLVAQFTSKNKK